MKVTVCELDTEMTGIELDWQLLSAHVRQQCSDLVLLPEMPFAPWLADSPVFKPKQWQAAEASHAIWLERFEEVGTAWVAGSRPVTRAGRRQNVGFLWHQQHGLLDVHAKYYLPDEERFWEASWYDRGTGVDFDTALAGSASVGFLICTELWFFERARQYGKQGAGLILTPRATERQTVDKWLAGGRALAVSSGAYSLSSNRVSKDGSPTGMGGGGWIIDPDGLVMVQTSKDHPFATAKIDLEIAAAAKSSYPRYVRD